MIVADTNLLVYLFVPGPHTTAASQVLLRDPAWVAPRVHAYELLNVMATHIRKGDFDIGQALRIIEQVQLTVQVFADPDREQVLRSSVAESIGSYDCEFVELARNLGTRVVTADAKMLKAFPDLVISINDFAAGK